MSQDLLDDRNRNDAESNVIVDIKRTFLSEFAITGHHSIAARTVQSETKLESDTSYDDLCGPWAYPENPAHGKRVAHASPTLCTWKFITTDDVVYMKKHQRDKKAILALIESKQLDKVASTVRGKSIFLELMWEVFGFIRDRSFSERGISAVLGLTYAVHCFFLLNNRCAAEEVYKFFCDGVYLHCVLDPPKSDEIFTLNECEFLFELFHRVYMENLVLFRLLCVPNYCLVTNIETLTETDRED